MEITEVWGVDPDSGKHGVAIYRGGVLAELKALGHEEFRSDLIMAQFEKKSVLVSMEDVMVNQSTFRAGKAQNKNVSAKMGHAIGRLYQSQKVLIEMLDLLGVPYKLHPLSDYWKSQSGKKQFERVTGWVGRSNEDTRSAAYFGFLEAQKQRGKS